MRVLTGALVNFEFAINDAERLLKLHDAETKRQPGRPSREIEVFKRAAIILCVTAWESFVEDTIRIQAEKKIVAAKSPADVSATFNRVAEIWLRRCPKPPFMSDWAGDNWKMRIREQLLSDLQRLNTPSTEQVRKLSNDYLGVDITAFWRWAGTPSTRAAARLDELIKFRGALVHKGPELFSTAAVHRKHVENALRLVKKLVERTEIALGIAPRVYH